MHWKNAFEIQVAKEVCSEKRPLKCAMMGRGSLILYAGGRFGTHHHNQQIFYYTYFTQKKPYIDFCYHLNPHINFLDSDLKNMFLETLPKLPLVDVQLTFLSKSCPRCCEVYTCSDLKVIRPESRINPHLNE